MLRYPKTSLFLTSIAGSANVNATFTLPVNDFDGVVAKLVAGTVVTGGSGTLDVFVQTSDDGGTTFYDCAHFLTVLGTITLQNAHFATIPVNIGDGVVRSPGTGSITAGTLGVPLLGLVGRVRWVFASQSGTTLAHATVELLANNQSRGS